MSQFDEWRRRCAAATRACENRGGEVEKIKISPPATEDDVLAVERALGVAIPGGFRHVLTHFAASFCLAWQLPRRARPPKALKKLFAAELEWNIESLPSLDAERKDMIKEVFPDPNDPYDRVWHNKLAVCAVPNGDFLALDLAAAGDPPLIYLSHDDGEGHGYIIGPNFTEAIDRWTRLGCVGPEDWQWLPFVSSRTSGLEPESGTARLWRKYFGIDRCLSRI